LLTLVLVCVCLGKPEKETTNERKKERRRERERERERNRQRCFGSSFVGDEAGGLEVLGDFGVLRDYGRLLGETGKKRMKLLASGCFELEFWS
jgi:hypothetical protein